MAAQSESDDEDAVRAALERIGEDVAALKEASSRPAAEAPGHPARLAQYRAAPMEDRLRLLADWDELVEAVHLFQGVALPASFADLTPAAAEPLPPGARAAILEARDRLAAYVDDAVLAVARVRELVAGLQRSSDFGRVKQQVPQILGAVPALRAAAEAAAAAAAAAGAPEEFLGALHGTLEELVGAGILDE